MTIQSITIDGPAYPLLMRSYAKAPHTLYCSGDVSLLNTPSLAVIGTRTPTPLGREIAYRIAAYFAQAGYTIVSGLALGCDAAAHKGALSVNGKTLAVLGTPLTNIYPKENRGLAERIKASGGLLISAYTDDKYAPWRFMERDHVQAALSLAVIPVQAGAKSGTLHTCTSALTQRRLVFVPLPVLLDEQRYPESYTGIRSLLSGNKTRGFTGKQDYPLLLSLLELAQQACSLPMKTHL